jgi:hypothetical protein
MEIPEILLENQLEISKFLHSIKTFPNHVAAFQSSTSKNRHQNQNGGLSIIAVPRVWIYFAERSKKRFERQCQILQN